MNKPNCCAKCFVPKEYGGLQPIPDCFDAACPCHAPMSNPECCEKCRTSPNIIPGVKAELERLGPHGCWLDNCTCHTAPTNKETTPEWEEEFSHNFPHGIYHMHIVNGGVEGTKNVRGIGAPITGKVKDFIRSLLATATAEAEQRGRDMAVDFIWETCEEDYQHGFSESAWKMTLTAARSGHE